MSEKKKNKNSQGIGEESGEEMNFLGHLDELRRRVFYGLIGTAIGSGIAAIFIDTIINVVLLAPARNAGIALQNLQPFGIPFLYFKVIFIAGGIISSPFLLYQIWRFIAPGLYETERSWARRITLFTSISFLSGVAFAYYVMIPSMLDFAASFSSENIRNDIDVNQYLSFLILILLAAGALFEMPIVSYILTKAGIISPKVLRKYWRHAIVVILILAAVLTPTPDPVSQMIFAAPLFVLYEISIWVSKIAYKRAE